MFPKIIVRFDGFCDRRLTTGNHLSFTFICVGVKFYSPGLGRPNEGWAPAKSHI